MSKVKITTLTSVHIGSGETYQYGSDFIRGKDIDGDSIIGIIDPKRVLALIGEKNLDAWVTAIDGGRSTDQIVNQYAPSVKLEQYSRRTILLWANTVKTTDTLKEYIHDGLGRPYIPGSSIKGAIRTAVLSSISKEKNDLEQYAKDKRGRITAKVIEEKLFGRDANSDVFRFLHIGDAFFGKNYEAAIRMVNINERGKAGFWDMTKSQLLEVLSPDDEATFELRLKTEFYEKAKVATALLPECMRTLYNLFQTINQHTQTLIEQEISYWMERQDKDDGGKVDEYLKKMRVLLKEVEHCQGGKECVLRIGAGSGWRFITGAWTENWATFETTIIPAARRNNQCYTQFHFPKTRRVDEECDVLGFVKLSMLTE